MKCKHVRELAGAYLYGDLSPEQMSAIRHHAAECEGCHEEITSQSAVLAAIPNEPPALSEEDMQRIAWSVKGAIKASEQEQRRPWFRLVPAYALAAAVVGVVAFKVVSEVYPIGPFSKPVATAAPIAEQPASAQPTMPAPDPNPPAQTAEINTNSTVTEPPAGNPAMSIARRGLSTIVTNRGDNVRPNRPVHRIVSPKSKPGTASGDNPVSAEKPKTNEIEALPNPKAPNDVRTSGGTSPETNGADNP